MSVENQINIINFFGIKSDSHLFRALVSAYQVLSRDGRGRYREDYYSQFGEDVVLRNLVGNFSGQYLDIGSGKSRTGQILGNDTLAMWLRAITTDPDVLQIVEIGAWEGKGSTRVFAEAAKRIAETKSISIVSLEASRERALRAKKRNKKFRFLQIVWGSIVSEQDLDHQGLSESENVWITEDINALKSCPLVLDLIPVSIDALFLDGGEFSTRKEYDLLFERVTKWLILDDTCSRKSASIAKEIRAGNTPFTVVVDSQQRNGFMIALVRTKRSVNSLETM